MSRKDTFVPHPECMVASGACFTAGECLSKCKDRSFYQHQTDMRRLLERIAQLEVRVMKLEKLKP